MEFHRPRLFQATPATFRALVQAGWQGGDIAALCGGESFPVSLVDDLKAACKRGVWNVYGPTETTIWSTSRSLHDMESSLLASSRLVPIGRPLRGTRISLSQIAAEVESEVMKTPTLYDTQNPK
eukprot:3716277-Amphidinium_carterae.2